MEGFYSKELLQVALLVQLVTLVSVFLNLPILRPIIGFIYLTFVPGFLLLRVFKVDSASFVENVLFSVGLSIASLMFIGLVLNTLGPILGFPEPLSLASIVVSVTCVSVVLFVLAYRDRSRLQPLSTRLSFSPKFLLLLFMPIMAIIGAEMVNVLDVNFVLLLLVVITCAVLLLSLSKKIVPRNVFPLIVIVIALSLLFQTAFSSNYLVGWDIHIEYYFANLTYVNRFWDSAIAHPYNGMLSVTILPVMYLDFLNVDLNTVFKIVYLLLFSLVPLALYFAFKKKTGPVIALLAVFFFMATDTFFVEMLGLARQIIAELFLALLVLLIAEDSFSLGKRRLLFIIFSVALIVSHYSLSYIFLLFLIASMVLTRLFKSHDNGQPRVITGQIVVFNAIVVLIWSVYVSPVLAKGVIYASSYIYSSLSGFSVTGGISNVVPGYTSPLHEVATYLALGLQGFILLGLLAQIVKRKKVKFGAEYFSLSIAAAFMLLVSVLLPSVANSLNMSRFVNVALFWLAPFCILGVLAILQAFASSLAFVFRLKKRINLNSRKVGLFLISILLVSYFLFQVGFVYEISGDVPTSISLSRDHINRWQPYMQQLYIDDAGFASASWLSEFADNQSKVYVDFVSVQVNSYGSISPNRSTPYDFYPAAIYGHTGGSYIYLGKQSTVYDTNQKQWRSLNATDYNELLNGQNRIFDDGSNQVYYKP